MADWRQIQARIRKAKTSSEPAAQLAELYERTRDAMVAFELAQWHEKAGNAGETVQWYTTAAQRFRRAQWRTKAVEALTRLGAPIPEQVSAAQHAAETARSAAGAAKSSPTPSIPYDLSAEQDEPASAGRAETSSAGAAESPEEHAAAAEGGPSAGGADGKPFAEQGSAMGKRRRRGRRGGRKRHGRAGVGPQAGAAGARTSATATAARPSHSERSFSPGSLAGGADASAEEASAASPEIEASVGAATSESRFGADRTAAPAWRPSSSGPVVSRPRAGDPGLSSRIAQLESQLRRLLACPLASLEEGEQAPAGPGVLLLSDSDQVTHYYVEACQTLRIGVGNLLRGGRGSKGASQLKPRLAEHLGISDSRVAKYLKDHCAVRWIQLDEGAPELAHFAMAVLRPVVGE